MEETQCRRWYHIRVKSPEWKDRNRRRLDGIERVHYWKLNFLSMHARWCSSTHVSWHVSSHKRQWRNAININLSDRRVDKCAGDARWKGGNIRSSVEDPNDVPWLDLSAHSPARQLVVRIISCWFDRLLRRYCQVELRNWLKNSSIRITMELYYNLY